MKIVIQVVLVTAVLQGRCTSGNGESARNKDVFDQASQLSFPAFTTLGLGFDGNIQGIVASINARGDNLEATCAATAGCPAVATIEGIVTIPSDYGIAIGSTTSGCATSDVIYTRSFVLQDANSAVLVAYGMEPPTQDVTQSSSAKYINNARSTNLAIFGDRLRITVNRVQKYGSGANINALVTDFDVSTAKVVSSRNSASYTNQYAAFSRAADLYRVRRLEGYVTTSPSYVECPSAGGTRQFQYNYQTGYKGVLCVGATSYADAQTCTGGKVPFNFQLSHNLGAGTLSGFDTGNSFSYNLALGARVRMTGPVYPPQYNQADSNLSLMLDQKYQVETLK